MSEQLCPITYWTDLEAQARALFERTAKAMGYSDHTPWDELAEQTRDTYRRELVRRLGAPTAEVQK